MCPSRRAGSRWRTGTSSRRLRHRRSRNRCLTRSGLLAAVLGGLPCPDHHPGHPVKDADRTYPVPGHDPRDRPGRDLGRRRARSRPCRSSCRAARADSSTAVGVRRGWTSGADRRCRRYGTTRSPNERSRGRSHVLGHVGLGITITKTQSTSRHRLDNIRRALAWLTDIFAHVEPTRESPTCQPALPSRETSTTGKLDFPGTRLPLLGERATQER